MKKLFTPTDDQQFCIAMLEEWACGAHHLPRVHEFGAGVCINFHGDLSTFDGERLTRLVLLAHRDAVRIEIANGGPCAVKIIAHRRKPPFEGARYWQKHPTLADLSELIEKLKS